MRQESSHTDNGQRCWSAHSSRPYGYPWRDGHFGHPASVHSSSSSHPTQIFSASSFQHGYGGAPVVTMQGPPTPAASFESHGSVPFTPAYMVGGTGPVVSYSYGPHQLIAYPGYSPPQTYFPTWFAPPPQQPVEYIKSIKTTDVLCGRGGATNSHSGNRSFRSLVKTHQGSYLKAKKRDKPSVAAKVVELIRKRGGRFLRRCEPTVNGNVLWVDIGDERAREKTCQALREGAPELRRRRVKSQSTDEDDVASRTRTTDEDDLLSTASSFDRRGSRNHRAVDADSPAATRLDNFAGYEYKVAKSEESEKSESRDDCESSYILRPSHRLLKRAVAEISVSELSHEERDLYKNFIPPNPVSQKIPRRAERHLEPRHYTSYDEMDETDDDEPWSSSFEEV